MGNLQPDPQNPSGVFHPPWHHLKKFTAARIALGRAGGSQATPEILDFRFSHAKAKDAVHAPFDPQLLTSQLHASGLDSFLIKTQATSRMEYLVRPDRGRQLSEESREALLKKIPSWGQRDLAIIISDGLSAQAAHKHATQTVITIQQSLTQFGWSIYPILLAPFGRVKLQDEIGSLIGARFTLILLGERPGLGAPDSLGAYFTFAPDPAKTDADRNCVSNIRQEGIPPVQAGRKIAALLLKAHMLQTTGVALKDEGETLPHQPIPPTLPPTNHPTQNHLTPDSLQNTPPTPQTPAHS